MRKLPVLGFATVLFVSCLPVPFDLEISQALATAAKMTRDNSGVITASYNQGGSQSDFVFFPQVLASGGFDYGAGFVTALASSSVDLQAVAGGVTYARWNQPIPNPDPHAPGYLAWPVKSGTSYLFGIVFDALYPASGSGYALFRASPPGTFSIVTSSSLQSLSGSTRTVIGAPVAANSSPSFDMLHMLTWDPPTQSFVEAGCQLQASGLTSVTLTRGSLPYPLSFMPTGTSAINRCLYFYDDNPAADPARLPNRSFASWYDTPSSSWVTYAWDSLSVFKSLPVPHRLDALLSTGQLLSTEDGTGRLYDRDGNLLATFSLGNLVYVAEEYFGGVPRCYFSQCLVYENQLHFNIYWIPTSQLATLAN